MKKTYLLLMLVLIPDLILSQGRNNTWLLGNDPGWPNLGRIIFDTNSYQLLTETRKMSFKGTEATISDEQGNFLMSSNGVWIANANNDTMMNGSGLNPSWDVNAHPNGLLIPYGNVLLPFPGDSNKYVLIHHAEFDPAPFSYFGGIHKSVIDISLDGGLGAVILKNDTLIQDQLTWGLASVKHGNGRDWWVIAQKDSSDEVYKVLLTPNGVESINLQNLGYNQFFMGSVSQITFSQDGSKFIQSNYYYNSSNLHPNFIAIADFDRCSGMFSNTQTLQLTPHEFLWGLAFSPSGDYAYACTSTEIFQINTSSLSVDTVAVYDGFISGFPPNCCATTFMNMYLAANGKIYITSGSSVQHLHEMNFPDSAGIVCDVQQHTIALGNYFHLRAVPNHPNYYLGALTGSMCDTLGVGMNEIEHDFRFSVSPNPSNGQFKIMYLLPQNKSGKLEIFDVNGRRVYEMNLPQWSTMQWVSIPKISNGVYNCVIRSADMKINKKIAVFKE